ncbi:MAG: hypothetical protein HYV28_18805 [Ignavibacteriales bacterium]|nr:hypothetical protein [Ignavibacteriales bacterium]
MDENPTYHNLLKLFFGSTGDDFKLPDISKNKLEKVQQYLKHLSFREEKEITTIIEKLYGTLPENRFFKEDTVLEEIAYIFSRRRVRIEKLAENIQAWTKKGSLAFDIIAYNRQQAIVINLYSKVTIADIDEYCDDLNQFKVYFDEFKEHTILGALGMLEIEEDAFKHAHSKGLYMLRKTGDVIKVINKRNFKPANW